MNINKIVKARGNTYKIYIDDIELITYEDVILDNNLLHKKNISIDKYNKIISDTEFYDVYYKTLKYVMKRRRSEKEVIDYLNKYSLNDDSKKIVIDKLKHINLINDKEYCKAYINDKVYLSKCGLNKIRLDLLEQNIPIDIIESELSLIDSDIINNRLEKLIAKKINNNSNHSNYYLKQKVLNEMINLGYPKDKTIEIINKYSLDDTDIIEKQFNKIFNSLSKKYSGEELLFKVKQKLISKGFKSDDINDLIQKNTRN